jgi:ABC-2 type transport system permease protein
MATDPPRPLRDRAAWQLLLMRFRAAVREPEALFWTFAFPLLASAILGLAFRSTELGEISIAVVGSNDAQRIAADLSEADGLSAEVLSVDDARRALRRRKIALIFIPGAPPELITDPTDPDGRTARLLVDARLERLAQTEDRVVPAERHQTEPGSRYIDFLIPGLLGMGLMSSAIWGLGWALVRMRTDHLLKRLVATPMSRGSFLLSFVLSRQVLAILEVLFFVAYGRWLFGVHIFGSVVAFVLVGLLGSLCFSGIGLLAASRAKTTETANGLMNLVTMPMMVFSGVFFSTDRFPSWAQPILKLLPLTALLDAMRAISVDGASLFSLGAPVAVLAGWSVVSFFVTLRFFRWV